MSSRRRRTLRSHTRGHHEDALDTDEESDAEITVTVAEDLLLDRGMSDYRAQGYFVMPHCKAYSTDCYICGGGIYVIQRKLSITATLGTAKRWPLERMCLLNKKCIVDIILDSHFCCR